VKQNSVHGVSRDHPDGAAIDEFDNRVQLPEVLAGGLHLHPQHPGVPSLELALGGVLEPLGVALVESDDGGGDAEATGRMGP